MTKQNTQTPLHKYLCNAARSRKPVEPERPIGGEYWCLAYLFRAFPSGDLSIPQFKQLLTWPNTGILCMISNIGMLRYTFRKNSNYKLAYSWSLLFSLQILILFDLFCWTISFFFLLNVEVWWLRLTRRSGTCFLFTTTPLPFSARGNTLRTA